MTSLSIIDPKLQSILEQAGALALSEQQKMTVSTKADSSLVTNGDIAVSDFLEQQFAILYPDWEVFSEEKSKQIPKGKKVIVIDPIDGTQSYSRKEDSWAVLVGFLDNEVAVKGVVYQPSKKVIYYAEKDKGAYKISEGVTEKITKQSQGEIQAWVSPMLESEKEFLAQRNVTKLTTLYSASLKIVELAQGNGDIYPNFRKKCSLWDLVAPQLILEECGGKIIYETNPGINFINPHINTRLVALGKRLANLVPF